MKVVAVLLVFVAETARSNSNRRQQQQPWLAEEARSGSNWPNLKTLSLNSFD